MSEVAYFISDLHLGSDEEPNAFLLQQFLDRLAEERPRYLFLLGDIFDLWIGDYCYFKKRFSKTLSKLSLLKVNGTEVHYFEGNHDLYLDDYFGQKLGMIIHSGPSQILLWSQRLRIEHGDQMDPDDKGYIFLRWFLRTPFMRLLATTLPEFLWVCIGKIASAASRKYTSQSRSARADVVIQKIQTHAEKIYKKNPFDALIAGHVHVKYEGSRPARIFNLGSWLNQPIALSLNKNREWRWHELN